MYSEQPIKSQDCRETTNLSHKDKVSSAAPPSAPLQELSRKIERSNVSSVAALQDRAKRRAQSARAPEFSLHTKPPQLSRITKNHQVDPLLLSSKQSLLKLA